MADNVLSVPLRFVEHHRYRFPAADPSTWAPVTDPVRGAPRNKIIYVFQAIGSSSFQLFKAYKVLEGGDFFEVSADDALAGRFDFVGPGLPEVRLPEVIQQQTVRYFFYVSCTAIDGSFLDELAQNRRSELPIVTLAGPNQVPLVIAVTDPLTITEQLANDYVKRRNACLALTTPFAEQSSAQAKQTTDLLKKRLIATALTQLDSKVQSSMSSNFKTKPESFLAAEDKRLRDAETARDQAALDCALWLSGPLMDFVRSAYRATEKPGTWIKDIAQLIKVEASAYALLADCYRGMCLLRTLVKDDHYLIREFVNREDQASTPDLARVQQVGKQVWDVVSKFWLATGGVMSALESRQGARVTVPNSSIPIAKIVRTYNTIFGEGILTQFTGNPASYKFRDPLDGALHTVVVTPELISVNNNELLITLQKNTSSKNPFTAVHFTQGISVINLGLTLGAAYDALLNTNSKTAASDKFFTAAKLLGGIVDTAAAFPRQIAVLLNLTGRGAAYLSLAGAVIGAGVSFADSANSWSRGDHDAALGSAIIGAGGLSSGVGGVLFISTGGVVTFGVAAFTGLGLVLVAVGSVIVALAQDSDLESFAAHCFLGDSFGQDSKKETWSPTQYSEWADGQKGLDSQIAALFNLVFAFELSTGATQTLVGQTQLTIQFGAYFAGSTFDVTLSAQIQGPTGPPTPFTANLLIDPADPNASRGTGALENGAVKVDPVAKTITIVALPRGLNQQAQLVNQVRWSVFFNLGENAAQTTGANPNKGFIVPVPGTVPTPKNPVVASGLNFGSIKSTNF